MRLLLVYFISSMLVLSIGCGSQDNIDEAELVKEVQLLRQEVNQLKCHYHNYYLHGQYGILENKHETNEAVVRLRNSHFGSGLCK